MPIQLETACTLLFRHARGEQLPYNEERAMQVALYEFWRRDPEARRWAGLSADTIEDVIQVLIEDVLGGRWPVIGEGKGKVATVTSGLLAAQLRNRLRHAQTTDIRDEKRLVPFGPAHDEAGAGEASEDQLAYVESTDDFDADDFALAGDEPMNSEDTVTEHFEVRCLVAARKTVLELDVTACRTIEAYLAPRYLDDQAIDGKQAALVLGCSAPTLTRRLQALGVTLSTRQIKRDPEAALARWLESPIGHYLRVGCGLRVGQTERRQTAMETLCACNSERLQALKP